MQKSFVVCDLETTGLSPFSDEIVEIGLVKIQGGKITDTFTSLVKHNKPLPFRVQKITGLSEEDFKDSPNLDTVLPKVLSFIGDFPLIGHNVKFDVDFLNASLDNELRNILLDTLELSRLLYPTAGSYRLGTMCEKVGVETKPTHRALEDAVATAELFLKLTEKLQGFDFQFLLQLSRLIRMADTTWKDYITGIAQSRLKNFSKEMISGKSFSPDTENDLAEVDDSVECRYTVEDILGFGGVLSKRFANYEYRPHQLEASRAIENAFAGGKHLVVEAGTGVGKSFAYLIPAILWSLDSKERVLVSTQTINLQEQLYRKDIPQLRKILAIPFKASLLKGRRNYLCLRRWQQTMNSSELSPEEAFFTARILVWQRNTETGDKAEFNMSFEEPEQWDRVCTDSENCIGSKCGWFYKGCYLSQARKKAEQSNLVIVNHSLLFSNLSADSRILPPYKNLVIDEAHHLEEAATDYLGKEVSSKSFAGLLTRTERYLKKLGRVPVGTDGSEWSEALRNAQGITSQVRETLAEFFALLIQFVNTYSPGAAGLKWQTLRLNTPELQRTSAWRAVESEKHNLCLRLQNLHENLVLLLETMDKWDEQMDVDEELKDELSSLARLNLQHLYDFQFILDQKENFVSWAGTIGQSIKSGYCYLKASPIDVSELLYEELFQTHESIILTSATMTVDSSFDFFNERTGIKNIDPGKYNSLQVGSPFSLEKQALFCIARDIALPGPGGSDEYHGALADAIVKLADVAKGRTMVLFTSHRTLRMVYHKTLPELSKKNIILLGQGLDGGRNALIREFKSSPRAVLFGAASFWEGVDLPGDFLKCVIIVRLPFQPPTIPIIEARMERLASLGFSAFRKLTLPHAVLKFKQGFGRLIRSNSDTGSVVVLDSRLVEKNYGNYFIRSLGIKKFYNGSIEKIAQEVDCWINNY